MQKRRNVISKDKRKKVDFRKPCKNIKIEKSLMGI